MDNYIQYSLFSETSNANYYSSSTSAENCFIEIIKFSDIIISDICFCENEPSIPLQSPQQSDGDHYKRERE